jgi:hypothetical protein
MAKRKRSRFQRQRYGYVQLRDTNLKLFSWIYHCRFATKEQLTLAIRGEREKNDRYIARALRKLFDHAYIAKLPQPRFAPDVYCVSKKCYAGRNAAGRLFGSDDRVLSRITHQVGPQVEHALMLTWMRIYLHLGCLHHNYSYEYFDHQDLTKFKEDWGFVPDGLEVLEKKEGRRLFCLEYQRPTAAEKSTRNKIELYLANYKRITNAFGAELLWGLFVFEKPGPWVKNLKTALEKEGGTGIFFMTTKERFLSADHERIWTEDIWYLPGEQGLASIFL